MYYYHDGENEVGPFSAEKLNKLASAGLVVAGTLVRAADSNSWVPYGQLAGISNYSPAVENNRNSIAEIRPPQRPGVARLSEADKWTSPLESGIGSEEATPRANPVVSSFGWLAYPPTPWRRYGARILDTTINGTVVFFLFALAFYAVAPASADDFFSIFESESAAILNVIVTAIAASILGGLLIGATGFTLGKWVFGIKVTRLDETKLGISAGLSRDFNVLVNGLFLGIPLLSLFTMWSAYKRLSENKPASWDDGMYIVWHRPSGTSQNILNIVGFFLILLALSVVAALDAL